MSYYQKYLKYKTKYIELQKAYLIGGGKVSAKNNFIRNFTKSPTINDNLKADIVLRLPSDIDMNNLDKLFEDKIYAKLLELFESKQELDNYIDFIIKSYLNNTFGTPSSLENIGRFKDAIQNYTILQNNKRLYPTGFVLKGLHEMTGLTGLNSLEEYLNSADIKALLIKIIESRTTAEERSRAEIKKRKDGEMPPIFESDNVLIYQPKTVQQSQYYGRDTKWCTSATNDNMFNQYNKYGPLYIFITNINKQKEIRRKQGKTETLPPLKEIKFQLHLETNSLMNDKDEPVDINTVLNAYNNDDTLWAWLIKHFEENVINIKEDGILTINKLKMVESFNEDLYYEIVRNSFVNLTNNDKIKEIHINNNIPIDLLKYIFYRCNNITKLIFSNVFYNPLEDSLFLLSKLTYLKLPKRYNKPLGNSLSQLTNLTDLTLGNFSENLGEFLKSFRNLNSLKFAGDFNQPLGNDLNLVTKLTYLDLGNSFNQPLGDSLSQLINLTSLNLDGDFNQPLGNSLFSLINLNSLKLLHFNQSLGDSLSKLTNLTNLTFGYSFNQPLGDSLFSLTNLTSLNLDGKLNEPLGDSLKKLINLRNLRLGNEFNQHLGDSLSKLTNLTSLTFGYFFNKPFGNSLEKLTNLTSLTLEDNFNQPLGDSLKNLINLTNIQFGEDFDQSLVEPLSGLTNLKKIILSYKYKKPLPESLVQIVEYR